MSDLGESEGASAMKNAGASSMGAKAAQAGWRDPSSQATCLLIGRIRGACHLARSMPPGKPMPLGKAHALHKGMANLDRGI